MLKKYASSSRKETTPEAELRSPKMTSYFFNGLGDAIARAYSSIRVDARIMLPEPTYSTHLLAEVLHASYPPNTYRMNPYDNWRPDLKELERKVRSSNSVVGILVINPDNPTGYVHTEEDLRKIVEIAKEYELMLIFDEIYLNMLYNGQETVALADIIGDVPGISMKVYQKNTHGREQDADGWRFIMLTKTRLLLVLSMQY